MSGDSRTSHVANPDAKARYGVSKVVMEALGCLHPDSCVRNSEAARFGLI